MTYYGSKQDLIYFALRRSNVNAIDDLVIKTSGEYLTFKELGDIIGMVMLAELNTDPMLTKIESKEGGHVSEEMNVVDRMDETYDFVMTDIINSLALK